VRALPPFCFRRRQGRPCPQRNTIITDIHVLTAPPPFVVYNHLLSHRPALSSRFWFYCGVSLHDNFSRRDTRTGGAHF
jgi:hypothetical protein